jgi:(p)ppGpp synthase/HD superfamily hydrolase
MTKFTKLYITLKGRMLGMGFFKGMIALEKAREIHDGLRKDGETPEFQHMLEIALHITSLKGIVKLEDTLICALLHDALEDYKISKPDLINEQWVLEAFGPSILRTLQFLDKTRWKDYSVYFAQLATDEIGAIVKLCDRVNNFQSMTRGKFPKEKQLKYAQEVLDHFLPMAKKSRKTFPHLADAFYNVEFMLKSQHELIMLVNA